MAKKVDPLNKKMYGAVTVSLTVSDVKAAMNFYQKAFGFIKRGILNGPDRKPVHAELTLRGATLMLGPEIPERNARNAKALGGSPATLYLTVEDVDKVFAKALKAGATPMGPVMDMFWGDRSGTVIDPDGNPWMIGTHIADPTPEEMKKKMAEMMKPQAAGAS
jgi:PhnB protein